MFGKKSPFSGRFARRMFRRSGFIFLPCHGFFCKDFERPVLLLLDTGANDNVLSERFVEENVEEKDRRYVTGVSADTANGCVDMKCMLWVPFTDDKGREFRENFLVTPSHTALGTISGMTGYDVVGVLGTGFMERHGIRMDFKRKEIAYE